MAKRKASSEAQADKIREICDEVAGTIYEGYSGRFMFGVRCLGITCTPSSVDEVKRLAREMRLPRPSIDNTGLDMICYWPTVPSELRRAALGPPA